MTENDKIVERTPIVKVMLERSLDGNSAAIVFQTLDGKELVFKQYDAVNGEHRNLDVQEI